MDVKDMTTEELKKLYHGNWPDPALSSYREAMK